MTHRRMAALITAGVLVLAACGGDDETTDSEPATDSTSGTTTIDSVAETTTTDSVLETTTTATTETTAATPTTQPDPSSDPIAAFADALETGDPAGLALLATGSAAFVYYEAVVLLSESNPGPPSVNVAGDGTISFLRGGPTLSDFTFDDAGLITDFTRNGTPMSTSVAASGAVFEGVGEGAGIIGTVHSFRYFDGDLQVVVTTVNNSQVEGELVVSEYVSEGREFVNLLSSAVRPTVTSTVLHIFDDVPRSGGVLNGSVRADGVAVAEATLDVPPLG